MIQTSEFELAHRIGVSPDTLLMGLIGLKRRGYISSTYAWYGRPMVIKVHHARTQEMLSFRSYCMQFRKVQVILNPAISHMIGVREKRVQVKGTCSVASFAPSSLLKGDGNLERLRRFIEWKEQAHREEEAQLRELRGGLE